jgi:DMSO/TMAO reductase YedYZ heme-binding membrane subunit
VTSEAAASTLPSAARGWAVTLRIAVLLTVASVALFATAGVSEESVRTWIRATARASVALFLMTFVARPLVQLSRSGVARWLLANRRYLGVAAAYAQLLHGLAIAWLFARFESYEPDVVGLIGGGLGFALYFAMALTSSDAAQAALGKRGWKALHKTGAWWIWFVFAQTNAGNVPLAFEKLGLAHQVLYFGIQLALVGALALRVAAWAKTRRT